MSTCFWFLKLDILLCSQSSDCLSLVHLDPQRSTVEISGRRLNVRFAMSHLAIHRLIIRHASMMQSSIPNRIGIFMARETAAMMYSMAPLDRVSVFKNEEDMATCKTPDAGTYIQLGNKFRRMHITMTVLVDEAGFSFCNDSQNSFGAPDTLYGTLRHVKANADLQWVRN